MKHHRGIALLGLLLTIVALVALVPLATCQQHPSARDEVVMPTTAVPGQLASHLEATLTAQPDDAETLVVLADLYAHTGRIRDAIPLFEKAIQLRPDDLTVRLSYAQALLANGYLADAGAQLRHALELSPENPQVLYLLGQVAERRSPPDLAAARNWYERAARAGDDPYARLARQRLQELAQA